MQAGGETSTVCSFDSPRTKMDLLKAIRPVQQVKLTRRSSSWSTATAHRQSSSRPATIDRIVGLDRFVCGSDALRSSSSRRTE